MIATCAITVHKSDFKHYGHYLPDPDRVWSQKHSVASVSSRVVIKTC